MKVMITGHRPPRIGGYKTPNPTEQWIRTNLRAILRGLKEREPKLEAISGMALGSDMIFAQECIGLDIPLIAAVPFKGQESRWPDSSKTQYQAILRDAQKVVIVDEIGSYHSDHFGGKMALRNKWMLDHSDLSIAVWDGTDGGTANTVAQIRRRADRKMLLLDPSKGTVTSEEPEVEEDLVAEMFGS